MSKIDAAFAAYSTVVRAIAILTGDNTITPEGDPAPMSVRALESGLFILYAETRDTWAKALHEPAPALEDGRIDNALADFLAEHTRLNQDGIDSHTMRIALELNYAALWPVSAEDIAEWNTQGHPDTEPPQ